MTDFNTSHVTVYRSTSQHCLYLLCYFNTSHVTVYHRGKTVFIHPYIHFNTSHVTVYHLTEQMTKAICRFQYIPCYGLSFPGRLILYLFYNFNTSHVTVYLMILSHFYLGIFHHFLYFTSFQHFLPADYKI